MPITYPFPNMMQMQIRVPRRVWIAVRFITLALVVVHIATVFVWPEWVLTITWKILVILAPITFFIAPGFWRNICPLAAANQLPRLLNFTRGLVLPEVVRDNAYLVALGLFVAIIPLRYLFFHDSGVAVAVFLIVIFGLAFTGGLLFKGKSGWCSQFCPLLPIQRAYGQTPFIMVRNSHCEPCVGCAKNCFDFNPRVAYLADLNDSDHRWTSQRKIFIGMLPGFIFGFNYAGLDAEEVWYLVYGLTFVPAMVSLGVFFILDTVARVSTHKISAVFAMIALNLYYWYSLPTLLGQIGQGLDNFTWPAVVADAGEELGIAFLVGLLSGLGILSLLWLGRTIAKEGRFVSELMSDTVQVSGQLLDMHRDAIQGRAEVTFLLNEAVPE